MRLIDGMENIYAESVIGNVRKAQEDSYAVELATVNGDVFVVCDGMGGHVGGKMASTIAVNSILEFLKKEKYADPVSALDLALQFANMQILGYADEHPELKGMGTTACVLLLQEANAYIAHVGDSRIYLYLNAKHQLHRITKDHSYVQTLVDAGQITDEEAESHPNKNRITKALGIKKELMPTVPGNPIHVKAGDIFLICSDGLCGMVHDKQMLRILSQNAALKQKGDELVENALLNGGVDNITVELIEISCSIFQTRNFQSFYMVQSEETYLKVASGRTKHRNIFLMRFVLPAFLAIVCMLIGYVVYIKSMDTRIGNLTHEIESLKDKLSADSQEIEKNQKNIKAISGSSAIADSLAAILNEQKEIQEKYKAEIDSLQMQKEKYKAKRDKLKIFKKD